MAGKDELTSKFLFDAFNLYYNKGLEAQKIGNYAYAKRSFLLAAESLLKLAGKSTGELRQARIERAERLMEISNSIDAAGTPPQFENPALKNARGKSAAPQNNGGEDDSLTEWRAAEVPTIRFTDVAGLHDVKKSINTRIILPMRHPDIYQKFNKKMGGGVLLYGPPGTGKTMIAKAIASEVGAKFYSVKCSDVVSKWFGEAEKNIRALFDTARASDNSIIFFDEIEALTPRRGGNSTVMNRLVPEMLAQIQGFTESNSQLLLLGATNRPWDMDEAMLRPGRFNELIYVGLPDKDAREFLFKKLLKGAPLSDDVNVSALAAATEGYTGADIEEIVDKAKEDPLLKSIETGTLHLIDANDFANVLKKIRRSVTEKDITPFKKYMAEGAMAIDQ